MKKCILLFCFFSLSVNILVGMNKDLYFLCNETQKCCICFESVVEISQRTPKGSVLALPCCYTGDKAKKEEVTILCASCFGNLKKFDRPPTFEEQAATEAGEFKTQFCCPVCRGDFKQSKPVPLTDANIVRGVLPKSPVVQPAVTKSDRLPHFRLLILKHLKDNTLETQINSILVQFPQFDRADIDPIVRQYTAVKNSRLLALMLASASVGYGVFLIGQILFKAEELDLLVTSAQRTHDALLSFNFDLSNPLLPLAQQYDIPVILTTIDDEASKKRLEQAITAFDASLVSVWQTITTRYYYQTADYFMVKEEPLVTQLQEARTHLELSIAECKKHKKSSTTVSLIKFLGAAGVAGICGSYWFAANPIKRWGLFV